MTAPVADTIVLTWNGLDMIRSFLDSYRECTRIPTRLIIIDNGSTDGTAEFLKTVNSAGDLEIKTVLNTENAGFVKGMNQGIGLSSAPFVCLANNDLSFTKGWLEEIVSVFESNKEIGVLNPASNNLGIRQELSLKSKGIFAEMPFCIGFCMVIRRQVIDKAGSLSEEFSPLFYEDTDYSLKALRAGYLIGVAKGAYVFHKEHGSVNRLGSKKEEYFSNSRVAFRKKWGKILRVLFTVSDASGIDRILPQAVELCRSGNHVWVAVRGLNRTGSDIFAERGMTEHTGVRFFGFRNVLHLAWMTLIKKKRYSCVITGNALLRLLLKFSGFNVFAVFEAEKIKTLKYAPED
jgi:GT2 family glycosyltransferase